MKNIISLFIAALFVTASVKAQSTIDSIASKYQLQPMPEALTIEKTFPVIGSYQLTAADGSSQNVTITLDSANQGIIWVEGLPEGRMKAYLRKSPGTYRILPQKSESGKQIPEGTLLFDPSTNTLNIALGKAFDVANPASVFNLNGNVDANTIESGTEVKVKSKSANSKSKTRVIYYTTTKAEVNTSTSTGAAKQ